MSEAEDKAKIKITIAKPIVGKKVFYFIQSIHAEKVTEQCFQPIVQMVRQLWVVNTLTNKLNKGACLRNQQMSTQSS